MYNKLTLNDINELLRKDLINNNEYNLLLITRYELDTAEKKDLLHLFVKGDSQYRIFIDNVDSKFYFQNIPEMLNTFYSLHSKYPSSRFDFALKEVLLEMSNELYDIYYFLSIINYQLVNEKKGVSPFKIVNKDMLLQCKNNFIKVKNNLSNIHRYEGTNRENGYLDVINEYNENFKSILNIDLFRDESSSQKTK